MQCFLQCISNQTKSTHLSLVLWQVLVLYPSEFSYLRVVQTYFLTFSVKPFLHLPTYKNFERINRKMKYSFGQTTLPYRFSCASFFVFWKHAWKCNSFFEQESMHEQNRYWKLVFPHFFRSEFFILQKPAAKLTMHFRSKTQSLDSNCQFWFVCFVWCSDYVRRVNSSKLLSSTPCCL